MYSALPNNEIYEIYKIHVSYINIKGQLVNHPYLISLLFSVSTVYMIWLSTKRSFPLRWAERANVKQ